MSTKAKINWGSHPYSEALRLSHTNNRYQSMLPRELERLIHSYLYRDDRPRRKKVIGQRIGWHDSAVVRDGMYYFSFHLSRWMIQKTLREDNNVIFYTTNWKYVNTGNFYAVHRFACTLTMSRIEEEIEEKRQQRIKLLGTLPLE